jgi:hypothetical protein
MGLVGRFAVDSVNMAQDTPTRSTRFPGDLDDRFEDYRDERDMTNSEALRSLVRTGLDYENGELVERTEGTYRRAKTLIGAGLLVTGFQVLILALVGIVSFFVGPWPLGVALMAVAGLSAVLIVLIGLGLAQGHFDTLLRAVVNVEADEVGS